MNRFRPSPSRPAFTVVELLVVIAVIGVLMAILLPALFMVLRRSEEFRIQNRINQLEAAVEKFKTDHGFYPPDFTRVKSADQFLVWLNRIAPNHNELSAAGSPHPAGARRVDVWWNQVGAHLGPESALTFWLSGLATNKQYPLTYVSNNGTPGNPSDDFVAALPPYNISSLDNGTQAVERQQYFEFTTAGLLPAPNLPIPNGYPVPPWMTAGLAANTCGYSQLDDGKVEPVIYFELASYRYRPLDPASTSNPPIDIYPFRNLTVPTDAGAVNGVVVPYGYVQRNASNQPEFYYYKKDSFQIFGPGVDGIFYGGNRPWILPLPVVATDLPAGQRQTLLQYSCVYDFYGDIMPDPIDKFEKDNLANGSAGRLDEVQQAK